MLPFSSRILFSFMLLGLLVGLSHEGTGTIEKRVDLRITNDLGTGANLSHHCKSKDDDLGIHVLAPNEFSEFRFRPNFWGTTLYFCRFWWGSESHWFDIYVQKRDSGRCDKKCWWVVGPDGPCLLDKRFGIYILCEGWNDQGHKASSGSSDEEDTAWSDDEITPNIWRLMRIRGNNTKS